MNFTVHYDARDWTENSEFHIRILDPQGNAAVQRKAGAAGNLTGNTSAQERGFYELQIRTDRAPRDKTSF